MWKIIHKLVSKIINPENGLGRRLLLFISQMTPLVNVELIVRTNNGLYTLLVFRDDQFYGPGWHLPGGIIRYKEKVEIRVKKTLFSELNILEKDIDYIKFLAPFEIIDRNREVRGHFISLLFIVKLKEIRQYIKYDHKAHYSNGDVSFHLKAPSDLIKEHYKYKKFIDKSDIDNLIGSDIIPSYDFYGKWK